MVTNGEAMRNQIALLSINSFYRVKVVIKMGNIVSRAGIKPTSVAFQASLLTIKPPRLSDVTMLPTPIWLLASEVNAGSLKL